MCGQAAPEAAEVGGWFVEVKARKAEAGLKSRFFNFLVFFGRLLLKDKQAQTSHLFLRNHSHLGMQTAFGRFARLRESCKGQLAISEVPTHWGCATTARGLLQWH